MQEQAQLVADVLARAESEAKRLGAEQIVSELDPQSDSTEWLRAAGFAADDACPDGVFYKKL